MAHMSDWEYNIDGNLYPEDDTDRSTYVRDKAGKKDGTNKDAITDSSDLDMETFVK